MSEKQREAMNEKLPERPEYVEDDDEGVTELREQRQRMNRRKR